MAILLIRHGETDSNAARVVQTADAPLSARGCAQAERLGVRLAALGVARVCASDLARALSTAEAVARATGAPLAIDPALAERNYGDVRGTPYAELTTDIFAPDYEPPGGETWADFHRRVDDVWATMLRLADATHGNLAVVTHGLVCAAVLARHLDVPPGAALDLRFENTCVTIIEPPRAVRALACAAHLDDTTTDGERA